jgi:hypothetical protein
MRVFKLVGIGNMQFLILKKNSSETKLNIDIKQEQPYNHIRIITYAT